MTVRSAAALLLLAAAGCGARGPAPGEVGPGAGAAGPAVGERVYVANQDAGTVSVLDASTHEIVATVDVGSLVGSDTPKPHHVAVEPDGRFWYVSLIGADRVLKLTGGDNRLVGEAELEVPGMLALDPTSSRLWVGRSMSAVRPPRTLGVIDRETMEVEEVPVLFPRPHAVALHPSAGLLYTASLAENTMAVVEPKAEDVELRPLTSTASEGGVHTLVQWAVSPDGGTLVGTGEMSGELLVYDLADPGRPELSRQVPVNPRPWHPVFTPDGAEVWFANKGSGTVTVVDTGRWEVVAVVEGGGLVEPHGAAISADGATVFVSSNNLSGDWPGGGGTVTVIDRESRRILAVVPVGANAAGIGTNARR